MTDCRAADLSEIFFSNEEYYSKLEELKKAHLRTMAELESMYRRKLQLKSMEPLDMATLEMGHRWVTFVQDYVRGLKLIVLGFSCLYVCLSGYFMTVTQRSFVNNNENTMQIWKSESSVLLLLT